VSGRCDHIRRDAKRSADDLRLAVVKEADLVARIVQFSRHWSTIVFAEDGNPLQQGLHVTSKMTGKLRQ
jgi:hypothetical protein